MNVAILLALKPFVIAAWLVFLATIRWASQRYLPTGHWLLTDLGAIVLVGWRFRYLPSSSKGFSLRA